MGNVEIPLIRKIFNVYANSLKVKTLIFGAVTSELCQGERDMLSLRGTGATSYRRRPNSPPIILKNTQKKKADPGT